MPKGVVMKIYLSAGLLALSAQAVGQVAKVEDFSGDQAREFNILIAGAAAIPQAVSDRAEQISSDPEQGNRGEGVADSTALHAPAVHVPAWMKPGRAVSVPRRMRTALQLADPDCLTSGYFPRLGLSAAAQSRRRLYYHQILTAACEAGIPVRLFDAMVAQESRYHPFARSHAGAIGMTQLMPGTARQLGVSDPWAPLENLRGGARYLRQQFIRYGAWDLALAAYNAGPGNVDKYAGIPPFRETRDYVRTILGSLGGGTVVPLTPVRLRAENPFRRVNLEAFAGGSDIPEH